MKCKVEYSYTGSTSTIAQHLRRKHGLTEFSCELSECNQKAKGKIDSYLQKKPLPIKKQEELTNNLIDFIISSKQAI